MSLLLDALKKAEEAKRLAGEEHKSPKASTPMALALEPDKTANLHVPVDIALDSRLPDLAQHIDLLDADLAAMSMAAATPRQTSPAPTPTPTPQMIDAKRSAARNVFAVKQAAKPRLPPKLVLGLIAGTTLGVAGAAYFWWQLQATSQASNSPLKANAPILAANQVSTPTPTPVPLLPSVAQPTLVDANPSALSPASAKPQNLTESIARAEKTAPPQPAILPAPAETASPIRLSITQPQQNSTLNRAYEALQADRLDDAQRDYTQALHNDTKNSDALLGLATIAARQGETERATTLYLSVLEANPTDVNAQAGLINLKGQGDPTLSESRLKTLLVSQPDSPTLNFTLGNLYARQSRWSDAQQAYFRAYAVDADNADTLFNLAVSLDHLHQNKLAAQYYQMALNTAGTRKTTFDREQVENRLLALQKP
jgi:Tfp pilus assembly protein PilF